MKHPSPCICDGMNQDCAICGGSGYLNSPEVKIYKTVPTISQLEKEKRELEVYLHPKQDSYAKSNEIPSTPAKSKRPKKKKKTKKEQTEKQKLRKLRKQLRKTERKKKQVKKREPPVNARKRLADARILAKGKKKKT